MSVGTSPEIAVEVQEGRPGDMPWVTPYLIVRDVVAAVEFVEAAFGFERRGINPGPDGRPSHASATWRDGQVMMGLEGAYGGTTMAPGTTGQTCPISLYVYCPDVDALARRADAAGARIKHPPMDTFYGDRICNLVDPDGYVWCFATRPGAAASA